MDTKPREPILIDTGPSSSGWHRIESFLLCPRKYAYRYLLNIPAEQRRAPSLGTLAHIGFAHYYARKKLKDEKKDPDAYYDVDTAIALAASRMSTGEEELKTLIPVAQALVTSYTLTHAMERLTVVSVEEEFRVTIVERWPFTARFDLVFRDAGGRVWIRDYKTAAKPSAATVAAYSLSGQILMAQAMGRALWGSAFGGVRIDLIQSVAPFETRRESPRAAPAALQAIAATIGAAEERIRALQSVDPWVWPATLTEHTCFTRYGPCAYTELCRWGRC